jgi:hypothetical protein
VEVELHLLLAHLEMDLILYLTLLRPLVGVEVVVELLTLVEMVVLGAAETAVVWALEMETRLQLLQAKATMGQTVEMVLLQTVVVEVVVVLMRLVHRIHLEPQMVALVALELHLLSQVLQ